MSQGRGRGPCLGPNVKFFCKRFLYVTIWEFFFVGNVLLSIVFNAKEKLSVIQAKVVE